MIDDSAICDECKMPCTGSCPGNDCPVGVGAMSEVQQMRILGNGRSGAGYALFYEIIKALARGRRLHPVFAVGKWQGIGRISAEVGELVRAIEKGEGREREKSEVIDSIVVLIRYWLEEYEATA